MTNTVPGVRARDIPSSFPRTMTYKTMIGELLSSAKAADVLLYIHEHPCCRRSDVYMNVSKSTGMRAKIESLERMGLLRSHVAGRCVFMELTEKGKRLVEVLDDIEIILETDHIHDCDWM